MTHWGHSFASDASSLRLLTADGAERVIALVGGRELKIGSAPEADLRLEGRDIAPRHCRIFEEGGRLFVVDHGSPMGTLINEQRCVQPTPLREGDRIGIGFHLLVVLPGRAHLQPEAIAQRMDYGAHALHGTNDAFVRLLEQEAAAWRARGRPRRLLLRRERLARALSLAERPAALEPWLEASAARLRRQQGARWFAAGLLPGLLCGGLIAGSALRTPPAQPPRPPPLVRPDTPPPIPTPRCVPIEHKVVPHETLREIAALYDVDVAELAARNHRSLASGLAEGDVLELCSLRPAIVRRKFTTRVEEGDTWDSLARKYRVPVDKLRLYNPHVELEPGAVVEGWTTAPAPQVPSLPEPLVPAAGQSIGKTNEGAVQDPVKAYSHIFALRCDHTAYASSHTLKQLEIALRNLRQDYNYIGELIVGDLSTKSGGRYGPHLSHQSGRDVDLWLPIRGGIYRQDADTCNHCNTTWCRPEPDEVDWDITLRVVQALLATGEVKNIFLDRSLHPRLRDAAERAGLATDAVERLFRPTRGRAAVTHAVKHERHLHVRFQCGADEPHCVR